MRINKIRSCLNSAHYRRSVRSDYVLFFLRDKSLTVFTMQASKILRVAFCCPNLSIRSAKSGFMRSCQFLLLGTYFYDRACLRQGRENVPFAVLRVTANAFITARAYGKGEANVPFAVLRFKANIFYYRMRLRQKRQKYRLRFCALRRMLL